ncbi:MAG: nicotinate (nicotinamide) nucleotide adenylyltransferase [Deltaproteobacteria bacterium]|nr:nicotinate (nicotinamide) nucleotide adenylyltransferase [Deltaproteobacteria bacterium]MBW2219470.1 nicotinate (nicotinamide) nucleotide adenylyltransferase [Deltaproteobacteria bacterium]
MRTGLFGGTFNPIHAGHVRVAGEIKEKFDFDRMIIIPSAIPPHKEAVDIAAAEHRFEMAQKAFPDKSEYVVSDIEIRRDGPSYTVDTVKHFLAKLSKNDEIYLVLGIDAFLEIDTWMSYMDLFELLPMVVMSRPGYGDKSSAGVEGTIDDFLKKKISDEYHLAKTGRYYEHALLKPVYRTDVTPVDISATGVRTHVKTGKPIKGYVPEKVEAYIMDKGLYR